MGILKQDHLTVPSDLTVLNQVQEWFDRFYFQNTSRLEWSDQQLYCLSLGLAEGFTNAVRHAHKTLPITTPIEIELSLWENRLEIRIWDRGQPFNPDTVKDPLPEALQEGGYGWFLLKRIADELVYQRSEDGRNCLLIVKYNHQ